MDDHPGGGQWCAGFTLLLLAAGRPPAEPGGGRPLRQLVGEVFDLVAGVWGDGWRRCGDWGFPYLRQGRAPRFLGATWLGNSAGVGVPRYCFAWPHWRSGVAGPWGAGWLWQGLAGLAAGAACVRSGWAGGHGGGPKRRQTMGPALSGDRQAWPAGCGLVILSGRG